jgi:hypothetical protein
MSATSRANWFWSDWLGDPAVRRLTPAERGVWIDLLGLAAVANPTGYVCDEKGRALNLEEIARWCNATSPDEVSELITGILDKGAASRDRAGRLYNRRMVREASVAAKRRANGQLGGAATRLKWQAFSFLPQQNAWQMPQPTGPPLSNKESKKESSFLSPASSLASARHRGALARSPNAQETAKRTAGGKLPTETTREDLDRMFSERAKQNGGP